MLSTLFTLSMLITLPAWFLLIFMPNHPFTRRFFRTPWPYGVFVALGAMYLFVLFGGVTEMIRNGQFSLANLTSVEGLAKAFANPISALIVWIHMVTMDLAGGYYIHRQLQRLEARGLLISVIELFTLLMGPLGMFIYALYRLLWQMRKDAEARRAAEGNE